MELFPKDLLHLFLGIHYIHHDEVVSTNSRAEQGLEVWYSVFCCFAALCTTYNALVQQQINVELH